MTRLSAATDGQPRQQHRPPLTACHRTVVRRSPTPFELNCARRQRRLEASLFHDYIQRKYLRTDDPIIIIGGVHTPHLPPTTSQSDQQTTPTSSFPRNHTRSNQFGRRTRGRDLAGIFGADCPPLEYRVQRVSTAHFKGWQLVGGGGGRVSLGDF